MMMHGLTNPKWINPVPQIEPVAGCCENGDELSVSIKCGEFLVLAKKLQFLLGKTLLCGTSQLLSQ